MNLRHLRYFVAVAEELHFGRAAKRVNITQPPLSKQIKELEQEVGVRLLERTNKLVKLTEPGRVFLRHAKRIEELLGQAVIETNLAERGEVGRLAIGYLGAAAFHLLPLVLRKFRENYPNVEVLLYGMMTSEQIRSLAQGNIDIGIMRPTSGTEQYRTEVMLRERFVVTLPAGHRLAQRQIVRLRDLANEHFIMFPSTPQHGLHRQVMNLLTAKFEPKVVQRANETRSIVGLVGSGIGIAILPASAQRMNISGVIYKKISGIDVFAEMQAVWRRDEETPVVKQFLKTLRDSKTELSELRY